MCIAEQTLHAANRDIGVRERLRPIDRGDTLLRVQGHAEEVFVKKDPVALLENAFELLEQGKPHDAYCSYYDYLSCGVRENHAQNVRLFNERLIDKLNTCPQSLACLVKGYFFIARVALDIVYEPQIFQDLEPVFTEVATAEQKLFKESEDSQARRYKAARYLIAGGVVFGLKMLLQTGFIRSRRSRKKYGRRLTQYICDQCCGAYDKDVHAPKKRYAMVQLLDKAGVRVSKVVIEDSCGRQHCSCEYVRNKQQGKDVVIVHEKPYNSVSCLPQSVAVAPLPPCKQEHLRIGADLSTKAASENCEQQKSSDTVQLPLDRQKKQCWCVVL